MPPPAWHARVERPGERGFGPRLASAPRAELQRVRPERGQVCQLDGAPSGTSGARRTGPPPPGGRAALTDSASRRRPLSEQRKARAGRRARSPGTPAPGAERRAGSGSGSGSGSGGHMAAAAARTRLGLAPSPPAPGREAETPAVRKEREDWRARRRGASPAAPRPRPRLSPAPSSTPTSLPLFRPRSFSSLPALGPGPRRGAGLGLPETPPILLSPLPRRLQNLFATLGCPVGAPTRLSSPQPRRVASARCLPPVELQAGHRSGTPEPGRPNSKTLPGPPAASIALSASHPLPLFLSRPFGPPPPPTPPHPCIPGAGGEDASPVHGTHARPRTRSFSGACSVSPTPARDMLAARASARGAARPPPTPRAGVPGGGLVLAQPLSHHDGHTRSPPTRSPPTVHPRPLLTATKASTGPQATPVSSLRCSEEADGNRGSSPSRSGPRYRANHHPSLPSPPFSSSRFLTQTRLPLLQPGLCTRYPLCGGVLSPPCYPISPSVFCDQKAAVRPQRRLGRPLQQGERHSFTYVFIQQQNWEPDLRGSPAGCGGVGVWANTDCAGES